MAYSYCPQCGAQLVVRSVDGDDRKVCPRCDFVLYENSRPCVGVLALDGDRVLLVKRGIEPFKGYWDIPGGFLESGEHPADGAVREMREETGLLVEPVEVLGIFMDVYGQDEWATLNVCYLAKVTGGTAQAGSDATGLEWFPVEELPADIAFNWEREALTLLRERSKPATGTGPPTGRYDAQGE
jgi:ADP-ribose pyrophosphatase YjhB (NUDIX family)